MTTNDQAVLTSIDRDQLIEKHLPLVRYAIGKMRAGHLRLASMDFEDLVGFGTIGLIQAIDRYDASKGVPFTGFAIARIRGEVLDAMRAVDPVGRTTRRAAKQIDLTIDTLASELGREPTSVEVQEASGIRGARYWSARATAEIGVVSLDNSAGEDTSWSDRISDGSEPVSAAIEKRELVEALATAVADLPDREKTILSLYYVEGLKIPEIARVFELSQTRVSQLMSRAYGRLRTSEYLALAA
jgi:RNA polymerase sigma factor for flagellar operon FliA